ncbi:MAG: hypothetical protein ACP5NV_04800 [Candidatus Woesearchaeota archaeon]
MKRFFKKIIAGIIGADVSLLVGILVFALLKIIFLIARKDLLISKYNIAAVLFVFLFIGFVYGIRSYHKRTVNSKLFKLSWINFWTTIMLGVVFSLASYIIVREGFNSDIGAKTLVLMIIILTCLMYPFAALMSTYFTLKRFKHHTKRTFLTILFNPIIVVICFWLFLIVVYNSMYVPCGVSISGIDRNEYTANTEELQITPGERILSIDSKEIQSLNDVKNYVNSLDSTKEVVVETDSNIYYVKTYMQSNNRYMGFRLMQAYCERKY